MWATCPSELDTPVLVFGFEIEDIAASMAVMMLTGMFVFEGFPPVLAVTVGFAALLRRLKKGKPPGFLVHLMHRWDILRIPGVLAVRDCPYSPTADDFEDL